MPYGAIDSANLVAPEFNIHNSSTSIGYINQVFFPTCHPRKKIMQNWEKWGRWDHLPGGEKDLSFIETTFVTTYFEQLAADPANLINELDRMFTHGTLSEHIKNIIKQSLDQLDDNNEIEERVRLAMYLVLISPDYAVME